MFVNILNAVSTTVSTEESPAQDRIVYWLKAIVKDSFNQNVDVYNMKKNIVKRHLKNLPRMAIWLGHTRN